MSLQLQTSLPAYTISVIMTMYTTEKYLVESLESILLQTFQNFEVILVNDSSTDNNREVAESYLEKFGGRLKIYNNIKNSKPSADHNMGLLFSRGEYVFFMDSGDLLMLDGLEKMYSLAKKFDADVVNLGGFYKIDENATEITSVENRIDRIFGESKDKIILDDNLIWRLQKPLNYRFFNVPCLRLFRRTFLIENEIFFPENIAGCENIVWKHGFLLLAKRIVHSRDILNFCRSSDELFNSQEKSDAQCIDYIMKTVFCGMQWINEIMNKMEFFKRNQRYRYEILKDFTDDMFHRLLVIARKRKLSNDRIYMLVRQEFGEKLGEHDVLFSVICSVISEYIKNIEDDKAYIVQLEKQVEQRENPMGD